MRFHAIIRVSTAIPTAPTKKRFRPYSDTVDGGWNAETYDPTSQIAILTTLGNTTSTESTSSLNWNYVYCSVFEVCELVFFGSSSLVARIPPLS
ncbi:hypothetical protein QL285_052034 [Trifolium repens]|nr:hypothetical protein QL285_052034 [Trifolium repens]